MAKHETSASTYIWHRSLLLVILFVSIPSIMASNQVSSLSAEDTFYQSTFLPSAVKASAQKSSCVFFPHLPGTVNPPPPRIRRCTKGDLYRPSKLSQESNIASASHPSNTHRQNQEDREKCNSLSPAPPVKK